MHGNLTRGRAVTALLTGVVAVTLAACSSPSTPGGTTGTSSTTPSTAATASPPASTAPPSQAPQAGPLSGTWNGHYSGAYTGTFTLTWTQSSNSLHGRIKLSSAGTLPINGTVNGSSITFGTVGSTAITYSGTVSGNSMSGTYQVQGPSGSSGGPWSASKA